MAEEQRPKKRGGCLKNALIILGVLFLIGACGALFAEEETTEEEATSELEEEQVEEDAIEEETTEEEATEVEESEPEEEQVEEESNMGETESSDRDVITIAEEQDYVIEASLIDNTYAASIDREVQNFDPADENHYRIQMDHHGGFLGSNNLDRITELIENITEENAEYDYLVFEILRTDNDEEDPDRWIFARFNQEQAENLLNEEEVDDDTFESIADAFVEGGQADTGFNETVIGVNEEVSFSEFTITVEDVEIIDGEVEISMEFRNDSDPEGLRFVSAVGMDVHQGDELLDETSGEYEDNLGTDRGVYYEHDRGIETPISLTYGLVEEETPLRIVFVPMLYEFEDNKEITIEIN